MIRIGFNTNLFYQQRSSFLGHLVLKSALKPGLAITNGWAVNLLDTTTERTDRWFS